MAVSKRLRYEILRRDGFACRYCGAKANEGELHVDHVVPVALGGSDEPSNLVSACQPCNSGKSATSPTEEIVEGVTEDSVRWAKALEEAAEIEAAQRDKLNTFVAAFDEAWGQWRYDHGKGGPVDRPGNWKQSVEQWYAAGLDMDTIVRLIEVTMTKDRLSEKWRYFCGCCWRSLKTRQEIARSLIERDEAGEE